MEDVETTQQCSQPSQQRNGNSPLQSLAQMKRMGLEASANSVRLQTYYPRLQRLCPPRSERLWVIGGRPGSFKTQLMWNLALDMALLKQRVLFVSLEQNTGELGLAALARFSGIETDRIELAHAGQAAPFTDAEDAKLALAENKIQATDLYLRAHGAEEHGLTRESVIKSATRHRFAAVFVDHLGMVDRGLRGTEFEHIASSIDVLRRLARGQVLKGYRPMVCVTSPLKRKEDEDTEDEGLPTMGDFRGSGNIESDADVALILRKRKQMAKDEEPSKVAEIDGFVVKQRQGVCPLVLMFQGNGATCTVTERHKSEQPPQHWQDREES